MKKLLSVALALLLALSCVGGTAKAVHAEDDPSLPKVGDVVHGFEVKEIRPFQMIGAQLVLFEHQRTGAKLLWIANEDTNRAFQLTFPTRPYDDTGLPHVFEHATLPAPPTPWRPCPKSSCCTWRITTWIPASIRSS